MAVKLYFFLMLLLVIIATSRCSRIGLMIIHNGDMHSKFEEFPEDGEVKGNNIGGFPRTIHVLKEFRKEAKAKKIKAIYLNSGDTLSGSLWYMVHRWKIAAKFMKLLKPDVISLGTHEFDENLGNLSAYLKELGCPVVCANADFSFEPLLVPLIKPSHVIEVQGLKIGIVGYLTPKIKKIARVGRIKFKSEILALQIEAGRLKKQGVKLIIALGHSGYDMDIEIADKVKDVDIIVGGFSHTLLWKGRQPGKEIPVETYPKVHFVNYQRTFILHAGSHTKYLGKLTLYVNLQGVIKDYREGSRYMSNEIKQDKRALALLLRYRPSMLMYRHSAIAKTTVYLSNNCERRECNFGNMITDAFVDYIARKRPSNESAGWSPVGIGLLNGGAIQASIPPGAITIKQLYEALPYEGRLMTFSIRGDDLVEFLEITTRAEIFPISGQFFQVSGLHVIINPDVKIGSRIEYVNARCTDCDVPKLSSVVKSKKYKVVTADYILSGNTGNNLLNSKIFDKTIEPITDFEVLLNYLRSKKFVRPEISDRFVVREKG